MLSPCRGIDRLRQPDSNVLLRFVNLFLQPKLMAAFRRVLQSIQNIDGVLSHFVVNQDRTTLPRLRQIIIRDVLIGEENAWL